MGSFYSTFWSNSVNIEFDKKYFSYLDEVFDEKNDKISIHTKDLKHNIESTPKKDVLHINLEDIFEFNRLRNKDNDILYQILNLETERNSIMDRMQKILDKYSVSESEMTQLINVFKLLDCGRFN